jgi:hypothetical protein
VSIGLKLVKKFDLSEQMSPLQIIFWSLYILIVQPSHKVGLLLNSEDEDQAGAISRVADYFLTTQNNSDTGLQIEKHFHDSSFLSVVNAVCALFEKNVVAIISESDTTLTKVQVNIASQFDIPIIAGVASNPFLESFQPGGTELIRLAPSDIYQSQAIFDLLNEYQWHEFSILASADDYGTGGLVHLQYLAAHDENFLIKNVQYFDLDANLTSSNEEVFSKELQLIKDSLVRVIVLNCAKRFTERLFK